MKIKKNRWRIAWKYRNGSNEGHGESIFTLEKGVAFAEHMNKIIPNVIHWVEAEDESFGLIKLYQGKHYFFTKNDGL